MDKKVLNAAAVVTMGVVFVGLGLTLWAGNQRNAAYGPAAITQDGTGHVWLLADRRLFTLDAKGTLLRQVLLADLGLDDSINALAGLPDGGVVAGSYDRGLLHVLDAQGALVRTIDPADTAMRHLLNGHALLAEPDRLYVAHIGHHRLFVLDSSGAVLHSAGTLDGQPGEFHFPNNIARGGDGLLYVPDTNHHEIEVLRDDLQRERRIPVPRVNRASWPVAAVRLPTGNLAVTILDHGMRRGTVALLDSDGALLRELELQANAQPLEILVRPTDFLVCDQGEGRFQVRVFAHDGTFAGEFGDAAFLAALREATGRHRLYGTLRTTGQFGALLGAVALLLVYRRSRALEEAADGAGLAALPTAALVGWRDQTLFFVAMVGPLLPAAAAMFALGPLRLPSGQALLAHSVLLFALLFSVRIAMRNIQHPRFAPLQEAQVAKQVRRRIRALKGWGAKEPVLAAGRAMFKGQGMFVLVSPVRVALVPILFGDAREIVPLKTIVAMAPCRPYWLARLIAGSHARALRISLATPGARPLELTFTVVADFERVSQSLRAARERWASANSGVASTMTAAVTRSGPQRPAWSSLLLSALLPGLGHLNQRRNDQGLLWLAGFGVLATLNGFEWFLHSRRIMEVSVPAMLASTASLVVLWLAALGSVWRHERVLRKAAA